MIENLYVVYFTNRRITLLRKGAIKSCTIAMKYIFTFFSNVLSIQMITLILFLPTITFAQKNKSKSSKEESNSQVEYPTIADNFRKLQRGLQWVLFRE